MSFVFAMSRLLLSVGLLANALLMTYADSVAIANAKATAIGSNAAAVADASATAISDDSSCPDEVTCPKNEVYSSCTQSSCKPKLCSERGQPVKSVKIKPEQCKPGCLCKDGYLRNNNATCVPEDQCGTNCADSEVLDSCPSICDNQYCPTRNGSSTECPTPTKCPPPVCKCRFNYRRAENGTCIPTRDCPPFSCKAKPNEEYVACPPICPSDTCGLPACTGRCPFNILIILNCNPTCRCVEGFCRQNGTCVPCSESPDVCPANEIFSTCIQGECRALNCSQVGKPVPCPRIDPAYCQTGCICKEGFYRDDSGKCVTKEQCKKDTCPKNEVYSNCTQSSCKPKLCAERGQPVKCVKIKPEQCKPGCLCKDGYLRNNNATCVPEDQCGTDCADSEELDSCPSICDSQYCPTRNGTSTECPTPTECPPPVCKCRFNYRRAENGTCIPTRDCPPFSCKAKPNEVYNACPPLCPSETCSLSACTGRCPFNILIILNCNPTCTCDEGFCRQNGTCVPCSKSPDVCPANETFSSCIKRELNCSQAGIPVACPSIDPDDCQSGCICKKGLYRAENGKCVPKEQCKKNACQPNEEPSTCVQGICRAQNCTQKGQPIACPLILEGFCQRGCVCKEGYLRDASGCCIPEDKCPGTCPPNEEYTNCTQAVCRAQNCTQRGEPIPFCPAIAEKSCTPGCVCQQGYLRNSTGTCIPEDKCPPIKCPKNEVFSTNKKSCPPETCIALVAKFNCDQNQPITSGCVCRSGYYRLNTTTPCIPQCQCPQLKDSPKCKC